MSLRLLAAVLVAILFALAQMTPGPVGTIGASDTVARPGSGLAPSVAFAQDDDDDDDDDDDEDDDDDDDDDDDEEDDDDDDDDDDGEDGDNSDGGVASPAAPAPPQVAATLPDTEATGTSNGADVSITLAGERLIVRIFPGMPNGVTLSVRKAPPELLAPVPGTRAGDLAFLIQARDAAGTTLTALPAEINVSVRYNNRDVAGLNEQNLTLSRLNPATNQWQPAPKLIRDSATNYIAASVMDIGSYVVHAP